MGTNVSSRRQIEELSDDDVNFNHFQILRAIGKGSFGKVCIVQKKDTQKMYAMKYMNKAICIEKDAMKNVLREAMILKRLEFPYLVNLWYTFQDDEDLFMVVDLLMGGDLRYHLQQDVRFSVDCVIVYLAELALTMDYLRSRQILHRDIKPDNLLFDELGHIHLTDFNVATVLKENQLSTSVCGTKAYMAPEIFLCGLRESRGYNFAVDWWGLGVVAFELLTRKRPFDIHGNSNLQECKTAIFNCDKKPLSRLRSFFNGQQTSNASQNGEIDPKSHHLADLIGSLLAIDPAERPTSQSQVAKNLAFQDVNWRAVRHKSLQPKFVPPQGHLNCDPTYELEEMIIESKPLHKKKKRLAKLKANQNAAGDNQNKTADECAREKALLSLEQDFVQYNREKQRIPLDASSSNITLNNSSCHVQSAKASSDSHLQVHRTRDTKSLSNSLECLH